MILFKAVTKSDWKTYRESIEKHVRPPFTKHVMDILPINNTVSGLMPNKPGCGLIQQLRDKIFTVARKLPECKESLTWHLFVNGLGQKADKEQKSKGQKMNMMKLPEVVEIALGKRYALENKADVVNCLKLHDKLGDLIYFEPQGTGSEQQSEAVVITNPQLLADMFR